MIKVFGLVPRAVTWDRPSEIDLLFGERVQPVRLLVSPNVAPFYVVESIRFDETEQIVSLSAPVPALLFTPPYSPSIGDGTTCRWFTVRVHARRVRPPAVSFDPRSWFRRAFWWFSRERRLSKAPLPPPFFGSVLAKEIIR